MSFPHCLSNDNLKAIKQVSLTFYLCVLLPSLSAPRLFAPHLHPQTSCEQTNTTREPHTRSEKSIAVEQKPLGSTRNTPPVQSASCYHGNTGRHFEHEECKMTPNSCLHHPSTSLVTFSSWSVSKTCCCRLKGGCCTTLTLLR